MTAAEIVALLGLEPHPEGGGYRQTFKDAASTAIYFLLEAGQESRWHRVHGSVEKMLQSSIGLRWHEAKQLPLLSWSSQARGFFTGRFTPDVRDNADLVRVFRR